MTISKNTSILLIPIGSYEWHGNHLPSDTDSIIATYVAQQLKLSLDSAILLPCINYGVSEEHIGFNNVGSVNHISMHQFLIKIVTSLIDSMSPKLIVFVNAHGGNLTTLDSVSTHINYSNQSKCLPLHVYTQGVSKKADELFGFLDTHAGSVETSLYKFICGEDVKSEIENPLFKKKLNSGLKLFKTVEIAPEGVINDTEIIEIDTFKARQLIEFMCQDLQNEINLTIKKIDNIYEQ